MSDPECTCKVSKHRTVFYENCYYHGTNGTMVARLKLRKTPITKAISEQPREYARLVPQWCRWRQGLEEFMEAPHEIYAVLGERPLADDFHIGHINTEALAAEIIESHNLTLERVQA